jgi:MFS family permease
MSAFKQVSFYLLTLGSVCSIAAVSGTQQNLKLFLSLDRHFTQRDAAGVLSLVLAFSIAGRLLIGWLADRFAKKYVMLLTYLLVAAGIPLLFLGTSRMALYVSAAIFGIGLGGDYMIIPLVTAEIFGIQILGRLLGVLLAAGAIADAVAPWLIGRLRDTTGSYSVSCFVLVALALLGGLAVLGLPERRRAA